MAAQAPGIVILGDRIASDELRRLVERFFVDMVKIVVDIERGVAAVGGELHADAETMLLEEGSRQENLWGANYYPGRGATDCLEYTALINIRPSHGNRSMEIQDAAVRERLRDIVGRLIGAGEPIE